MAEIIQSSDLDEENKKKQSSGTSPQVSTAPSPISPGQQTVVPKATQQPSQVKQGSGFTNLQKVLQANQGNKLGQTVVGGLQGQIQQGRQSLDQSQQQFQQGLNQGRELLTKQQGLGEQIGSVVQGGANTTDQDIQNVNQLLASNYSGPQGLQDASKLQNQAAQAAALAQMGGSTGGKEALLQRFVGGTNYTSGQRNLDAALLGSSAAPELREQTRKASALQRLIQQSQAGAEGQASVLSNQIESERQKGLDAIKSNFENLKGEVDSGIVGANQQTDKLLADLKSQTASGTVSKNLIDQLGLGKYIKNGVLELPKGFDINKATTGNVANVSNSLTDDQLAKAQVLSKLTGLSSTELNPYLKRGSDYKALSFDNDSLVKALGNQKASGEAVVNSMNNTQKSIFDLLYNKGNGNFLNILKSKFQNVQDNIGPSIQASNVIKNAISSGNKAAAYNAVVGIRRGGGFLGIGDKDIPIYAHEVPELKSMIDAGITQQSQIAGTQQMNKYRVQ